MSPGIEKGNGYPREFREKAVRYWLSSGKKASVVAQELGVSDWSLNRWHKEMEGASGPSSGAITELNALELAKDRVPMKWVASLASRERGVAAPTGDFKKGNLDLFSGKPKWKYEVIESMVVAGTTTIRAACQAFSVSESGFYAHRHKEQRSRRQQDAHIAHEMKDIFEQNYQCYGSPRLVKALKSRGFGCGKTRIRRLMKQEGLCPKQKRRFRLRTTHSHPYLSCAPNVIAALPAVEAPAERFHSDITYIPTKEGFLYLAATIDAFTRRCAGW